MKKLLLSFLVVFSFLAYALLERVGRRDKAGVVVPPANLAINQTVTNQLFNFQPQSTATPNSTGGNFKEGSYTGSVADAFYGNIQVQAIISGGKITDVQFLQYPNDRGTSIEINSQAMPYLKQEAITAQSASVDIISGATQSSLAFRQSLGSALNQAQ